MKISSESNKKRIGNEFYEFLLIKKKKKFITKLLKWKNFYIYLNYLLALKINDKIWKFFFQ